MSVSLREKKFSTTQKRLDGKVNVTSFWGDGYEFNIRLLAYQPLNEDDLEEIIEAVVEKRKVWTSAKNNFVLSLPQWQVTAFIPKSSLNTEE